VTIAVCGANVTAATTLYYWSGSTWTPMSDQTFTANNPSCVTATIDGGTNPTLLQLSGLPIAVAAKAATSIAAGAPPLVAQGGAATLSATLTSGGSGVPGVDLTLSLGSQSCVTGATDGTGSHPRVPT
jgi:hypothetical protein